MCFGETNLGHYGGKKLIYARKVMLRTSKEYVSRMSGGPALPKCDMAANKLSASGRCCDRWRPIARTRRGKTETSQRKRERARARLLEMKKKAKERGSVEKRRVGSKEKHSGGRVGIYYISPVRYNPRFLLEIANVPESSFVRRRCFRSWCLRSIGGDFL